jgi:lysophospholipase L1-like esterase
MRFFRPLAIFCAAFAIMLGMSEGLLRALQIHYPASLFAADPDLGFVLRPYSHGWSTEEVDSYIRINSDGMRDREHSVARPPDTVRIAFVGDSATEAVQMPLSKTYVGQTEAQLRQLTKKKIETLNFGVLNYSLSQDLIVVQKKIWKYDPQVVVVALSVNALLKSVRPLYPGETQNAPFFVLENGSLVLDGPSRAWKADFHPSTRRDRLMEYINASQMLSLVNAARVQTLLRWDGMVASPVPLHAGGVSDVLRPMEYEREWPYLGPATDTLRQAWEINQKLLLAIRDEVARHHAELWLVTLDMPMQSYPDPGARLAFQRRLGVDSLYIGDELVAHFAAENGIRHLTMAPALTQYVDQIHKAIHLDRGGRYAMGHLNETGQRALASRLASWLHAGSDILN